MATPVAAAAFAALRSRFPDRSIEDIEAALMSSDIMVMDPSSQAQYPAVRVAHAATLLASGDPLGAETQTGDIVPTGGTGSEFIIDVKPSTSATIMEDAIVKAADQLSTESKAGKIETSVIGELQPVVADGNAGGSARYVAFPRKAGHRGRRRDFHKRHTSPSWTTIAPNCGTSTQALYVLSCMSRAPAISNGLLSPDLIRTSLMSASRSMPVDRARAHQREARLACKLVKSRLASLSIGQVASRPHKA